MEAIKNWVFNLDFLKEKREELYRRSFSDSMKDLRETNAYDTDTKAKEIAKKMLNDLLSPSDLNSIVTMSKSQGLVYIGGVKADESRLANLKSEAEFLVQSNLWKLIQETPRELAQRSMFVSGESLADMQKGKSVLYTLSIQKNIVDTFLSFNKKQ